VAHRVDERWRPARSQTEAARGRKHCVSPAPLDRTWAASEDAGEFHAYKSMERGGEGNCSVLPDRPMGRLIEESIDA
jgi:hypothetical protein